MRESSGTGGGGPTTLGGTREDSRLLVASQWQLIRWKFFRHKLAVVSLAVLAVLYVVAIFAEFFAPYDPRHFDTEYIHSPPHRLRFVDGDGRFSLRPFVYEQTITIDRTTLITTYSVNRDVKHHLRFFAVGDHYEMWGLIPSDRHLFGTSDPDARVFLLGTDRLGRDVLSRIIVGARVSLSIGLVGIAISFFLGITLGGVSGYFGGKVDLVIQRIIEFIRSIPTLPLWMGLSVALPAHWSIVKIYFGIVVILSFVGWTSIARVVRGKFLALREEDFVTAARVSGAREGRVIFRHLLPSFSSHVIAAVTLRVPEMILGETALSFIGLGMQAPAISWGVLLKESQAVRVLAGAPWLLVPGIFIIITVLAFNFVGDGLRDAADPYTHE